MPTAADRRIDRSRSIAACSSSAAQARHKYSRTHSPIVFNDLASASTALSSPVTIPQGAVVALQDERSLLIGRVRHCGYSEHGYSIGVELLNDAYRDPPPQGLPGGSYVRRSSRATPPKQAMISSTPCRRREVPTLVIERVRGRLEEPGLERNPSRCGTFSFRRHQTSEVCDLKPTRHRAPGAARVSKRLSESGQPLA